MITSARCTGHSCSLLGLEGANVAPHLHAPALHPDDCCLPLLARRGKDASVAALVGRRQLKFQPARCARAVEGLECLVSALAAASLP